MIDRLDVHLELKTIDSEEVDHKVVPFWAIWCELSSGDTSMRRRRQKSVR